MLKKPTPTLHMLSQSEAPKQERQRSSIGLFKNYRKHRTAHLNARVTRSLLNDFVSLLSAVRSACLLLYM